jgi:hypothetical protein
MFVHFPYNWEFALDSGQGRESSKFHLPEPSFMPRRYKGWKNWAIALRKRMYQDRCTETTVTVDEVAEGLGANPAEGIGSKRFWDACSGQGSFDTIAKQGLLVEFEPKADGTVKKVTFRLNPTWMNHFERVRKRELSKQAH